MDPFRLPPPVELGPLDVGLAAAAARALRKIPAGGRLLGARDGGLAPHAAGAIGSAGLCGVGAFAFVAATSAWRPEVPHFLVTSLMVVAGGFFLALVMRAFDRVGSRATVAGEVVGRAARRITGRLARLGEEAERAPERFGGRRVRSLERTLAAARDPEVAAWIPPDVLGRSELLLARAVAARGGPAWTEDRRRAAEVRRLLEVAATHLEDPEPAIEDLGELEEASASPSRRGQSARA